MIGNRLLGLIQDEEVYILDKKQVPDEKSFTAVAADLSSASFVDALPANGMDAIIHLAQFEDFRNFPQCAEEMFTVNTLSTLRLLEYARQSGAGTFILASSGGVYGSGDDPFMEDSCLAPFAASNFYLTSKACSEALALQYQNYMNVIVLRFFFVYGPEQRKDMLIPRLIHSVKEGLPITLQGEDGIKINPTYVSDAARAVLEALKLKESQIINVAGPDIVSMRQIGSIIGEALHREPVFETHWEEEARNIIGSPEKMSRLLGAPLMGFSAGIRDFLSTESGRKEI